jgi:hypothetical protein
MYPSIFAGGKKKDIFSVGPLPPTGIQKSSHIAKRLSYSNQKPPPPGPRSGFNFTGSQIVNEGLSVNPNKVVLMSRNVFTNTNNVGFNTAEAI